MGYWVISSLHQDMHLYVMCNPVYFNFLVKMFATSMDDYELALFLKMLVF